MATSETGAPSASTPVIARVAAGSDLRDGAGEVEGVDVGDQIGQGCAGQRERLALAEHVGGAGREPGGVAGGEGQAGHPGGDAEVGARCLDHGRHPPDDERAGPFQRHERALDDAGVHLVEVDRRGVGREGGVGPGGRPLAVRALEQLGDLVLAAGRGDDLVAGVRRLLVEGHLVGLDELGRGRPRSADLELVEGDVLDAVGRVEVTDPERHRQGLPRRGVEAEQRGALTQHVDRGTGDAGGRVGRGGVLHQRGVEHHLGVCGHERHEVGRRGEHGLHHARRGDAAQVEPRRRATDEHEDRVARLQHEVGAGEAHQGVAGCRGHRLLAHDGANS